MAVFRRALADGGFIEGQSVTVDYQWAEGRFDQMPAMAAEFVRRPVALIVTFSPRGALAAKAATTIIPIVFHSGGDVVRMGLVASRLVLQRRFGTIVVLSENRIVEAPLDERVSVMKSLDLTYYDEAAAFFRR